MSLNGAVMVLNKGSADILNWQVPNLFEKGGISKMIAQWFMWLVIFGIIIFVYSSVFN